MAFNLDDGADSTAESEDERFTRLRTSVKALEFPDLPHARGLRPWLDTVYENSCAASNRSKQRTTKFLDKIVNASVVEEVDTVSKRWDGFDTALGVALKKVATGAITRELLLYLEECQRAGKIPTGAASLFLVLSRYEVERGQAVHIDIATLLGTTVT